ncbi:MAG: type II toxin-antitoxin system HipA family toxin [Lachnospiraceae bacterium]|nr:type II toxin-antitoxin system HipA family toxin [Lachnospiraceae bacterium]
MINTAEVYLWGTRIGIVHLEDEKNYASFEYDRNFVESEIEVSPIKMPLSNRVYEFPTLAGDAFHGVPGMLADSLPDKFGNAVIERWLISKGKSQADFNVIDRLCYTGKRAMGALEYVPATGNDREIDDSINVSEMVKFASDILNNKEKVELSDEENLAYEQLIQLGTSAGGARAKAVIAWNEKTKDIRSGQILLDKDYDYWLMKFDGVNKNGDHGLKDSIEYTLIEYAYYQMAVKAGINMNECRIYSENGRNHFMTKRFDRVNGKKIHMQTLGALAHIDYNIPGLFSYEQAADVMKRINLTAAEREQFYRRMVFNVVAVNQDDHVKNTSFLMDKTGKWSLAPAYDITFSYDVNNKWLSAHQMLVNGKNDNINLEDMIECGKKMDISTKKCKGIIEEVISSVDMWEQIAGETGIDEKTIAGISNIIKKKGLSWHD